MKIFYKFLIISILLLSTFLSFGQKITISGKVIDSNNLPVVGVNVSQNNINTATDFDGNYSIVVDLKSKIKFSSVGFETVEIQTPKEKILNVVLKESRNDLNEIVVVGYGSQKKSVITGAISSVKAKDLENVPNGRIEQALQGRVAGVTIASNSGQPGSGSTIRIRGITTFGGANDPLYVVDGFVVGTQGIGFLNQADIESIEVLKDAASAAIYGTRAATGVILVTTKKGKSKKLSVSYNGFSGISSPSKTVEMLNATQYATIMNEKAVAGGGSVVYQNPSALGQGTNWQDAIFNNRAQRFNHELSFSGATEYSNFFVSFGIQEQQGIVQSEISNFVKKNIRLNSTHKLSDIFTFGQTVGYARQVNSGHGDNNREFGGPLSSALNLDPTTPVVVTDPNIANQAPYSNNPIIRDAFGNPYGISAVVGQEMTNPMAFAKTRLGAFGYSDDFVGNAFLEATPHKDFKFRTTFGGKLAYFGGQGFTPKYYLNATNQTQQNSYGRSSNNIFEWNIENTATYSKKFKKHNLSVLLGQGAYVAGVGGGSSVTITNLPITNYQDASFNFDIPEANRTSAVFDFVPNKLTSLFSRVTYDFDEKYLFTGIIRRDGSSRFGGNNKFGIFPSMSAGWVVSRESFWQSKYIDNLKIRGGYGIVGNDGIRDFGYAATVNGGFNYSFSGNGTIVTGYAPRSLENPDLRWEETNQFNIGFESRLLNSLNVTFDYFKKTTNGILRPIQIPGYVGVSDAPVGNVADMFNEGLEFELGYKKSIGDLNLGVNANFATLKNQVTNIGVDQFVPGDARFQVIQEITRTQVGQSINSFFGYKTAGIFQNVNEINAYVNSSGGRIQPDAKPGDFRWEDTNGDGQITPDDRKFLGNSLPKYTYGFTLNADYKGFDLMVFFQGAGGNQIFQGLRRLDINNANYQIEALGRWTGEGTSNTYPRLTTTDTNQNFSRMSDFYLQDGDYLRLKILSLGYSLPKSIVNTIKAQRVRFYLTGENLLTFTKYTGFDPEVGGGVFGVDKGFYPQARSILFGVNMNF